MAFRPLTLTGLKQELGCLPVSEGVGRPSYSTRLFPPAPAEAKCSAPLFAGAGGTRVSISRLRG